MTETSTARAQEIWVRLGAVTDPELDEPVTELGFVSGIVVEGADVTIGFRLPTYWCAANFAFMMADDMRQAAASVSWVRRVSLSIDAHMYAVEINRGMAQGLSFEEAFPAQASGDLTAVRRIFAVKAFQRRQERALQHLLDGGHDGAAVLRMTVGELCTQNDPIIARYLEKRGCVGPAVPDAPGFVDADGEVIDPACLREYLLTLRRVTVNVEFNGALCRGLLAARYDEEQPEPSRPGLLDFIRQHRQAAAPCGAGAHPVS